MPSPAEPKYLSPWWRQPGVVYFVAAGSPAQAIKIGVTQQTSLFRRLRAIHCTNHLDPRLLGIMLFDTGEMPMLAAQTRESELHKRFAAAQLRKAGTVGAEWFRPTRELLDYIQAETIRPDVIEEFPHLEDIRQAHYLQVAEGVTAPVIPAAPTASRN